MATWPCGCQLHHAVDHNKRLDGAVHIPHRTEKTCGQHKGLFKSVKEHHEAMQKAFAGSKK